MTARNLGAVLFAAALLVAATTVGCGVPRGDAALHAAYLTPMGEIGVSAGGVSQATDVDDLGLEGEAVVLPRAVLQWGGFRFRGEGFIGEWSGKGELDSGVEIGSQEGIDAGTEVKTDLGIEYLLIAGTFDIIPGDLIDIGLGLGVGYLGYDIDLKSLESSVKIGVDDSTPIAYPLIHVGSEIGPLRLSGDLAGIAGSYEGTTLEYLDVDVNAALRIFGEVTSGYIVVGYRYMLLGYEFESGNADVHADVEFHGPYLGFMLTF